MGFGIIVIGDEILSGRRRDRHLEKSIELLNERGERLRWARMIGDEPDLIKSNLKETFNSNDAVFCFGGIGATPDDMTRQCAASVAGVELVRHPDAVTEIEARFGDDAYPTRILMADLPEGSELIPNPYNRIPGFTLGNHHFLPGFPVMAHPMMEWVLKTLYPISRPEDYRETEIIIEGAVESDLVPLMEEMTREHPEVKLFSLPVFSGGKMHTVEFGFKGRGASVEAVMHEAKSRLTDMGIVWREKEE